MHRDTLSPGEGSLTTNLLPGEKVLRYEADEGSLLSASHFQQGHKNICQKDKNLR
jgi:hypothetical protein